MTITEKRNAYKQFFQVNEAGKAFMEQLQFLIDAEHTKAEDKPDLARDHVQRAKGIREVVSHINSLTAGGR